MYGDCALKDGLGVVISLLLQIPLDDGTYFPLNTHRLCDRPDYPITCLRNTRHEILTLSAFTTRNGLLAATTAALHDIGCGIISATVMTKNGVANNSFVVSAPDGCGAEAVKLACLAIASK